MIEKEAYVLAAGLQKRYELSESKMMAKIDDSPAISYTMKPILSVFPEEFVGIISSELFQNFNDFVTHRYPQARLIIDDTPGLGTAKSLIKSFPWSTESVFVTEGNIFYDESLITSMYGLFERTRSVAVLGVTQKHDVAPTHRRVQLSPKINLTRSSTKSSEPISRNIGAYFIQSSIENFLYDGPNDIIDCLALLVSEGAQIVAYEYLGTYLHLMNKDDVQKWQKIFGRV